MIAVLDACVLFPRVLRDTLLDIALTGMYAPRWSDRILGELRRNLVAERGMPEEATRQLVAAMQEVFPEATVDGYDVLIPAMTNHPKDRHVLAAAVHAGAGLIVTNNLADFPLDALTPYGIVASSPDDYLRLLYSISPDEIVHVLVRQAAGYRRPPLTPAELLQRLAIFAPNFVRDLSPRLTEGAS